VSLASNCQTHHQIQIIRCRRQSKLGYTNTIYIALSYKRIPYTEVAYINCLANSSSIFAGKTPVPNSGTLSGHQSTDKKPY
jgi:hypothetical protein